MKRRKILIIEDDASVRECYGKLFRREGYEPRLEAGGVSVERNLEEFRDVPVAILDYRMPGLNGLELLRRLRGRDFNAEVVLVTAFASQEMIEEAGRLGVRQILSKPVDIARLLRAVEESFLPQVSTGKEDGDGLEARSAAGEPAPRRGGCRRAEVLT